MFRMIGKTLFVAFAAALLVAAFAYTSSAFMAGASPFTYTGKVVAIDYPNEILTVAAKDHDALIFDLGKDAVVTRCDGPVSFKALEIGDEVTVSYHQEASGNLIAGDINLSWYDMGMRRC